MESVELNFQSYLCYFVLIAFGKGMNPLFSAIGKIVELITHHYMSREFNQFRKMFLNWGFARRLQEFSEKQ